MGTDRPHRGEEPGRGQTRRVRIVVLGGTRFIGRAIVEELVGAGHNVLVVHRGNLEPDDMPLVPHLHCDRSDLTAHRNELAKFRPEAAIDCRALTRADAETALAALPAGIRLVVISSMDVYRAFGAAIEGQETDPVPIDEDSPVRSERYPYRGKAPDRHDYDKLDVEDVYLPEGATSLRLPMVYGPRDYQLREEFILRRVRAGRTRIPFGAGAWLACRGYVGDIARGARLALESTSSAGMALNLCEDRTFSMAMWSRMILEAAGSSTELVRVADEQLPEDLKPTGTMPQHIAASARRARAMLGWTTSDPAETLRATVRWHLDHPPSNPDLDFSPDDRALGSI
jgi:nucleoside-diphosphate-sugar epimerase